MSPGRSVRFVVALGLIGATGFGFSRSGQADDPPKKVALLVGVNRYRTRILVDKPLQYAERDVEGLAEVLRDQGFEVRTLVGDGATKKGIDSALDAVLKGRVATDLVLLAFAGHGVQMPLVDAEGKPVVDTWGKPLGDAYFCPVDAVFGKGESMISLTRLFERLDAEGGINLMLVDACRDNPDPNRSLGGRVRSLAGDELNGRLPGNSAILFSCSAGQKSLETSKAGGGHGVFIHHVIEGLKGRAADPATGEVGWDELVSFVRRNVNARAKEWEPELGKEADKSARGRLQDPHQISNMVERPILARVKGDRSGFAESIGIKIIPLPEGSFWMGSPDSDKDAQDDEKPRHRVSIPGGRGLGATEVTVGQFGKFVADTGYRTEAEKAGAKETWRSPGFAQPDDHPVVWVSWNDAVEFCRWLTRKDSRTYRLPTEAEWEYACRAGTETRLCNGNDSGGVMRVGNVTGKEDGFAFTAPVGGFEKNAWGFSDMHGNVWEWCQDYYDESYYKNAPPDDPQGPVQTAYRVRRGGSWINGYPATYRSAARSRPALGNRDADAGFRVARVWSGQ